MAQSQVWASLLMASMVTADTFPSRVASPCAWVEWQAYLGHLASFDLVVSPSAERLRECRAIVQHTWRRSVNVERAVDWTLAVDDAPAETDLGERLGTAA